MLFPDLPARISEVRGRIAEAVIRGGRAQRVTIVAVTKTLGADAVHAAWAAGVRDVGENRVQEALAKMTVTTDPVQWHLIGHVQRNKAKAVDAFSLVHSLDSARLADTLHDLGRARNRPVHALLQVNVTGEASKFGWAPEEVAAEGDRLTALAGIRLCGVMTMAPFDAGESILRAAFEGARDARAALQNAGHPATELSMGMSNDYEIAVEEGATMVRLGTVLFGARTPMTAGHGDD